jgi:Xaa-Pro aminopeptidase
MRVVSDMAFEIPLQEFKERVARLQKSMQEQGVDLLLAYGNEAEPQYIRYLSDYWPSFETAGVMVPAEGKPLLLIGPESLTYASDRSKIADIRLLKAFRESSEPEYPGKKLDTFRSVIDECMKGRKLSKVGIAGLSLLTVGIYNEFVETLKEYEKVELIKADQLLNNLRMIKTENELVCMREAARITSKTFDYLLDNISPGMTESQIIGLALGKMHELGAERESYPMWALTGEGSEQAISRARHKVVKPGDMTQIQIGARVAGYASSIGRPVIFGKASDEQKRLIETAYAGQKTVLDMLRPGIPAASVAIAYEKTIRDLGYGDWFLYGPCHGNGLMEGEAPWIESNSVYDITENMTFCVDIFLGNTKAKSGLRIEDVIRVTSDGIENLTNYPRKIFEL